MTKLNPAAAYNLSEALKLVGERGDPSRLFGINSPDIWQHINKAHEAAVVKNLLDNEPIRTIHHLSCTGGTLIAKCIASMSNVLILNEIDLHSELPFRDKTTPKFTPTDIVALLRQGLVRVEHSFIAKLLISNLAIIREEQWRRGQHVVLRDHSHSFFLVGEEVPHRETLHETIARRFAVRSLITVRNPVDSWLSMKERNWHEMFSPSTFDEYCRRYSVFLQRHDNVPLVRYEDFVTSPSTVMRRICDVLELGYFDGFEETFRTLKLSGDSGRSRPTIGLAPRREHAERMEAEYRNNDAYNKLSDLIASRRAQWAPPV